MDMIAAWWLAERFIPFIDREYAYRLGQNLWRKGEFTRAMRFLAPAARRGHPEAQLRVGQLYLSGDGVPPSRVEAVRWLGAAAEANHPEAQLAYARMLWSSGLPAHGVGVFETEAIVPDAEAALRWASRAADAGLPRAQALLGQMLCFGPQHMRDEARGERQFRRAAEAGLAEASLGLALLLNRRAATEPTLAAEARRHFARAADGGSAHALFALGVFAEQAGDPAEAGRFYRDAAERGHRDARARWGRFLMEGVGCERQPVEGESLIRKAALAGDADSAAWLGDHYARAGDVPPNLLEAAIWYQRAADIGHAGAARELGRMQRDNLPLEAASWFRRAVVLGELDALAEMQDLVAKGAAPASVLTETLAAMQELAAKGDAEAASRLASAQYRYGRILLRQAVTDAECAEARVWIARAAGGGVMEAKAVLGEMMLHGRGGHRDTQQGLILFETAASSGHLGAIFATGVLRAGAEGVTPDLALSQARLRQAAERGHAPAQLQLAQFLESGLYGAPDPDCAATWRARARQGA